jgi:hypothetical protein
MKVISFRAEEDEADFINKYVPLYAESRAAFVRNITLHAAMDAYMKDKSVQDVDPSDLPVSIRHWVDKDSFSYAVYLAKGLLR